MNTAWAQRLTPQRLLLASVVVALVTMGLKTLAWWLTGSVGLLSDAMESMVNLAGAMFGLWMVTIAARPADADHPYGHHKAEYFSSGFEGILIIVAALGIVWAAVSRWAHPQPLQSLDVGLGVAVLASGLNGLLAWLMLAASRVHRSVALEGDARHLLTDVWTSVGVLLGLALVWTTGWLWLDPVVAILVAINILKEGGHLVWKASQGLMDEAMPPEAVASIERVLRERSAEQTETRFDHVVTRQAGQRGFANLHMHVPGHWTLAQAAAQRQAVEQALTQAVPGLVVTIELLPVGVEPLQVAGT